MWAAITARSGPLCETDGGRDLDLAKHLRTHDQRMFDAAHQLICGTPDSALASAASNSRPHLVVGVTLDHLVGNDPAAMAEQIGLGLIPDSTLHADHQTLYRDLRRRSKTRPATPYETPRAPINHPKRE